MTSRIHILKVFTWCYVDSKNATISFEQICFSTKITVNFSVCCSTQTKYWIPVLKTYWSIITSIAFQIILVQYQYSIEILYYFSVSLSVFKNKLKCPKFDYFIVLKRYHFRKCIGINFFYVNSHQKCQIVYIIEQNVIYALNK